MNTAFMSFAYSMVFLYVAFFPCFIAAARCMQQDVNDLAYAATHEQDMQDLELRLGFAGHHYDNVDVFQPDASNFSSDDFSMQSAGEMMHLDSSLGLPGYQITVMDNNAATRAPCDGAKLNAEPESQARGGRRRALRYDHLAGRSAKVDSSFWKAYGKDEMRVILEELMRAWKTNNRESVRKRFKYHFDATTTDILLYGTKEEIQDIADVYDDLDGRTSGAAPSWFAVLDPTKRRQLLSQYTHYSGLSKRAVRSRVYQFQSIDHLEQYLTDIEDRLRANGQEDQLWKGEIQGLRKVRASSSHTQLSPSWYDDFTIAQRKDVYGPFIRHWSKLNVTFQRCKERVDRVMTTDMAREIFAGDTEIFHEALRAAERGAELYPYELTLGL